MDKIKCEVIRDLMPLVADDVASAESKELVDGHMESCETCKAYYAGMTAQLARTAVPEDRSAFVDFSHRMEKRVRMKKVLIALTAAIVALCVVVVGVGVVHDKMNTSVHMDIDKTQAWLWYENDGETNLAVLMNEGYGWYHQLGVFREGDILYLTPYEPEWKLWKKGDHGGLQKEFNLGLLWEDDQLYYYYTVWEDHYYAESDRYETVEREYKIPLRLVRWGNQRQYTTIYEQGDTVMTREEVYEMIYPEEVLLPSATMVPVVTPEPTATMEAKLLG